MVPAVVVVSAPVLTLAFVSVALVFVSVALVEDDVAVEVAVKSVVTAEQPERARLPLSISAAAQDVTLR
jgi:hypothetical protein